MREHRLHPLVMIFAGLLVITASTVNAAMPDAEFARLAWTYLYRPEVFADQKLSIGIPDQREALRGALWYLRLNDTLATRYGMDNLHDLLIADQIPGVDFSGNRMLTDADLEVLFRFDSQVDPAYRFRLLRLGGTLIDDRALPLLRRLSYLEVLELGDRVTNHGIDWLKKLPHLRALSLTGASVTDAAAMTLAGLSSLRRLKLQGTGITDAGLAALKSLPLREIGVGSAITDRGISVLAGMPSLEQVDLSLASVTATGLAALAGLPKIHTLFLGPSITDPAMPLLAGFKNLKRLDLSGAAVSDQGLAVLSQLPQLQELALSDTQATGAILPQLARLTQLRYLEISGTRISVEDLRRLPMIASLQVISFSAKRRLTETDLRPLGRFVKLHTILINGIALGPNLVNYLKEQSKTESFRGSWLLPEAEAADTEAQDLEKAFVVASAPALQDKSFGGFHGLKRIHEAESGLDQVVPVISNPDKDTTQETEQNFLGEITVNAGPSKKKK